MEFPSLGADYKPLNVPADNALSVAQIVPRITVDRFGLAQDQSVSVVVSSKAHERAQLVLSILDMIKLEFGLTCLVENYTTAYNAYLFDAGWLLAIIDTCSLLDNLFEQSAIDGDCLLLQWRAEGFGGYVALADAEKGRDKVFEAKLRLLRNKIAAHLDANAPFQDLHREFVAFDLQELIAYVHWMANVFLNACRQDIRTKIFATHGMPLQGCVAVAKQVMPFDDN
jgi:hypothetical protein